MSEIIDMIGNFGVLVVIAGVFLYDHITTNKKIHKQMDQNSEMLKSINDTNANTTKSLELLQDSMNENKRISTSIEEKVDCIKRKAGFTS